MYSNNFRIFVETSNPGIAISDAGILAQLLHGYFASVKPTVAVTELIPTATTTKVEAVEIDAVVAGAGYPQTGNFP